MNTKRTPLLVISTLLAMLLAAAVLHAAASANASSGSQPAWAADISGLVTARSSGKPLANARVSIDSLGLETLTDPAGRFGWQGIPLPQAVLPVTITVAAPGYGQWRIRNVRLVDRDTLLLTPAVTAAPQTVEVPTPDPQRFAAWTDAVPPEAVSALEDFVTPATITVRVTGNPFCNTSIPYTVTVVDFNDYVKHVLPNEWIPGWPDDSLRAGAMAAKMYGWYWAVKPGKWNNADVYDSTCDQVYNPAVAYDSTNEAVDATWNWRLASPNRNLFYTAYRAYLYQCVNAGLLGECMGQWDTYYMAAGGRQWQDIVLYFYQGWWLFPSGYNLRFDGSPGDFAENRVLIPLTATISSTVTSLPVNVGAGDFTIEWWLKVNPADQQTLTSTCAITPTPPVTAAIGSGIAAGSAAITPTITGTAVATNTWVYGDILLDRSSPLGGYGVSLSGGRVVFGVSAYATGTITTSETISGLEHLSLCATTPITDGIWHHIAVQRRAADGRVMVFVDGQLDAAAHGPKGNISFSATLTATLPADGVLAIGAWKADADHAEHPFFHGWLEELRFSNSLRYSETLTGTFAYSLPSDVFTPDAFTVALYHFDDGEGDMVRDSSNAAGGPSHGQRFYGGTVNGPAWTLSDLFNRIGRAFRVWLPLIRSEETP